MLWAAGLCLYLLILACPVFAGGPLIVDSPTGAPYLWSVTSAVLFNPDQGGLGILPFGWDNATATSMTEDAFQKWQDVTTASITYANAGSMPFDVDETNFDIILNEFSPDGLNPIVFDEDGAIFVFLFGPGSGVIGFATPNLLDVTTFEIVEGFGFLNGEFLDGNPDNFEFSDPLSMFGTMVHEFGHYSGLAHTVVNGQAFIFGEDIGFGVPTADQVEIMYPFALDGQGNDPLADDIASLSTLYPEPGFFSSRGTISGRVLSQSLSTVNGVNVIVRNSANPFLDAVSAITGDFIAGDPFGNSAFQGLYTINNLTPGASYRVEIDQILAGGFSTPPLFPFIGPEEYYNGVNESSDPALDDPDDFDLVPVAAGAPVTDVDVIFNGSIGDGTVDFFDDMESGENGWTTEGPTSLWHQSNNRFASPTTSWYYGQEGVFNFNTGSANSGRLISPSIDLTGASASAFLEFSHFASVEGMPWEHPIVQVSTDDGANWTTVFEENNTLQFVYRLVDISAFVGQIIRIGFFFDTIDAIANDFEGWYVDDVRVTTDPDLRVGPLVLESFAVDDGALGFGGSGNGDGVPNSGEDIDIIATVRNDGSLAAVDVVAEIVEPIPPFLFISDFDIFFGTIEPGQSVTSFDFDIFIDPSIPTPSTVDLAVKITPGNFASFMTTMTLNIEAPPPPPPVFPGALYASTGGASQLLQLDPLTGAGTLVGFIGFFGPVTEIEFREDGTLFGATGGGTSSIITINVFNGAPSFVGIHEPGAVNGLEFDATGTLYGTYIPGPNQPSQLVIVDATGALTFIGPTGFNNIGGLAFGPDGTLYGATSSSSGGDLVTINTATGAATLVGATGFNEVSALEFGPNGILYGGLGGQNADAGSLVTIDLTTGAATLVGPSGFATLSGLSFFPDVLPAKVTANTLCPPITAAGCSISVKIQVDMSESPSPNNLLGSFTASLSWNAAILNFTSASLESGFTGLINDVNAGSGELIFNGADPGGVGGLIDILTVDFEVIGFIGDEGILDLEFSAMAAALSFGNLLPFLITNDCDFSVDEMQILGDLNGDGVVNSTDALICLTHDVGLPLPPEILARIDAGLGDVNGDGVTNSTDCLIMLSFDAGIFVPFPIGEPFCPGTPAALSKLLTTETAGVPNRIQITMAPADMKIFAGQTLEVPVMIDMPAGAVRLGSYTASLTWNPQVLEFVGYGGGAARGFESPLVNSSDAPAGKLVFAQANPKGAEGSLHILNARFKVIASSGSSDLNLNFLAMASAGAFIDLLPYVDIAGDESPEPVVAEIPQSYLLGQNYPNPFNPETSIHYDIPKAGLVHIAIYNVLGQQIRELVNRNEAAGSYEIVWNGKSDDSNAVPSGVYILRMRSGNFVADRKLLLLK